MREKREAHVLTYQAPLPGMEEYGVWCSQGNKDRPVHDHTWWRCLKCNANTYSTADGPSQHIGKCTGQILILKSKTGLDAWRARRSGLIRGKVRLKL